jgi:anthranilate phosphoribosyltransferase
MSNAIQDILTELAHGRDLSDELAEQAFHIIMNGGATPAQMGAFLMGLRQKGETVTEITAGARVLRAKAASMHAPANAIDTCGTGGDGKHTFNISTAVAIITAACGVPVAKHGNRSISSASGSADVLRALGVGVDGDITVAQHALTHCGLCFMNAPRYHAAMRHIAPVRVELGLRTIFNLLGPLANPAKVTHQIIGVYDKKWLAPLAQTLHNLGSEHAWVVCGADGIDELTTTTHSYVCELKNGTIREFTLTPEDAGLVRANEEDLRGGTPETNAHALTQLLQGTPSAYRDIVLLNTAAALIIADKVNDIAQGITLAREAITSGTAWNTLQRLVELTNASPPSTA